MSRRVYAAWRSATIFLQGCPAGRSSWGLSEASVSSPERPSLEQAQKRLLFSTLKGSAEQAGVKTGDEGHAYDEDKDSVQLFIRSYFAAKNKYPSIALVVRETGEARKAVKDLLDTLKSGRNALPSEGDYMEGPSVMEESTLHAKPSERGEARKAIKDILDSLESGRNALPSKGAYMEGPSSMEESILLAKPSEEVYMESLDDMASGDAAYSASESLWSKDCTRHGVMDKSGPLASNLHTMASEEASMECLKNMEGSPSGDALYVANEFMWSEGGTGHGVKDKFEPLASTLQAMASEQAYMEGSDTNNLVSSAARYRTKSFFRRDPLVEAISPTFGNGGDTSDQELLELLKQANSKENAIKKTAPLIEVLQQTASSSRRVHLSACGGAKKDLSWNNTLLSIMPSLANKKQQNVSDDGTSTPASSAKKQENVSDDSASCTPASSAKSKKNAASTQTTPPLTSVEKKKKKATCEVQYGVKLISTKRNTVLNQFSSPNLVAELKCVSQVFSDLQENVLRVTSKDVSIYAILYFKTYEGMMDALKLKTLVIKGETLFLERESVVSVEDKLAEDLGAGSFSSKHDVFIESSPEGESLRSLADDANQSQLPLSPDFLRNTITIEEYPFQIPIKNIHNFFSVFGALQIFYGKEAVFINFENECDKRKALQVHQFVVDGFHFQIRTDVSPNELVIRLVTDDTKVDRKKAKNACKKYGCVTHFQYPFSGILFAHYADSEKGRVKEILRSLHQDQVLIKHLWKPSLVYEGFKSYSNDRIDEKVKSLLDLSREVVIQVEKIYSDIVHHTGCS